MGLKELLTICAGICIASLTACSDKDSVRKQIYPEQRNSYVTDENVMVNKEIIRRQNDDIILLAKRYEWELHRSSSGLCYQILNSQTGNRPQPKETVQLKGRIYTPQGDTVYDFNKDGVKELIVDNSEDAVGLHELVKLMKVGEKANAIIPSYLAYGVNGNEGQIPAYSPLVCEIGLVKIINKHR
jgi:FKBP-type peptidyl-prolyl cis-trans isomerase